MLTSSPLPVNSPFHGTKNAVKVFLRVVISSRSHDYQPNNFPILYLTKWCSQQYIFFSPLNLSAYLTVFSIPRHHHNLHRYLFQSLILTISCLFKFVRSLSHSSFFYFKYPLKYLLLCPAALCFLRFQLTYSLYLFYMLLLVLW